MPPDSSNEPNQPQPYTAPPASAPGPAVPAPQSSGGYDFIIGTNQVAVPQSSLLGTNSMVGRVILVLGGLLLLLIVGLIVKGLLSGSSPWPEYIGIAQDQQALIHLATNATKQKGAQGGLSSTNQNFALTAQLSLTSARTEVITYLESNGQKVDIKVLGKKINLKTDTQLAAAATGSTYDQTFHDIMETKLKKYQQDLKRTYAHAEGKKGRQLLSDKYKEVDLLLVQLNSDKPIN